jgi:hypothetical protein
MKTPLKIQIYCVLIVNLDRRDKEKFKKTMVFSNLVSFCKIIIQLYSSN